MLTLVKVDPVLGIYRWILFWEFLVAGNADPAATYYHNHLSIKSVTIMTCIVANVQYSYAHYFVIGYG